MSSRLRGLALRASVRAYRLTLLRYPRRLREAHGTDMERTFRQLLDDGLEREGLRGLLAAWSRILRDLVRPLPRGPEGPGDSPGPSVLRSWRNGLGEDLRFAVRSLVRDPRFSVVVVAVLGAAVAACVSVFALLSAYLVRPLPFPHADRLVSVQNTFGAVSWDEVGHLFERAVSWDLDVFILVGGDRAEMTRGAWVTPDFLDTYAVQPALGRTFRPNETGDAGARVAMISHRIWRQRFGSDPDAVGRSFRAYTSDRPEHAEIFTIVGVLQPDFWYFNDYTDVLVPIQEGRALYTGRLRSDVSFEQAEAALTELAVSRLEAVPEGYGVELVRLQEQHAEAVRPTLLALQTAVVLVLLIAFANGGVLLLVRTTRRGPELRIRRALGAGRLRIGRQLLTEGLILAMLASAIGLAGASIGLDAVQESVQQVLGRGVPGGPSALRLDPLSVALALGTAVSVGLAFGLIPLLLAGGRGESADPGRGTRSSTPTRARKRLQSALVATEVGLSLTLLTGAGLMIRSAAHLHRADLGFDPTRVERGVVGVRAASYPGPEDRARFHDRLRRTVEGLPEVEAVALTSTAPFTARFDTRPVETAEARGQAVRFIVDEAFFQTLRIPLLRGRAFRPTDVRGAERVAVVSRTLASTLWPGSDPLGRRVRLSSEGPGAAAESEPWLTVVGVVGDVRRDVADSPVGDLYLSARQTGPRWVNLLVRRRAGAPPTMPSVRELLPTLDPEVPLASVGELEERVAVALAPARFTAAMLTGFAAFALVLAVLGLYGVIAYAARQRQRDVAIRMVVGADRGSVTRHFLRRGLSVVAGGLAGGALAAVGMAWALADQLHGVSPFDATTHLLGLFSLTTAATLAVWLPARGAARADPMSVLREE